jgi:hypothetical protein
MEDFEESMWWNIGEIIVAVHRFFKKGKTDKSYIVEAMDALNDLDKSLEALINKE